MVALNMHLEYMASSLCFTDRATCRCLRSGSVLERALVEVRPRGALALCTLW